MARTSSSFEGAAVKKIEELKKQSTSNIYLHIIDKKTKTLLDNFYRRAVMESDFKHYLLSLLPNIMGFSIFCIICDEFLKILSHLRIK